MKRLHGLQLISFVIKDGVTRIVPLTIIYERRTDTLWRKFGILLFDHGIQFSWQAKCRCRACRIKRIRNLFMVFGIKMSDAELVESVPNKYRADVAQAITQENYRESLRQ